MPSPRFTLVVACLAVLMVQLDTTIVNLGLHAIQADLGTGVATLQWVVDAYNVLYACLILTGGLLGDVFGSRRWFMVGVVVFTVASTVCALAPSVQVLITARAAAGVGAALALPGSFSLLTVAYPDARARARAVSIWAGINGVAIAMGPTLGGLLVDSFGWHALFVLVVPVGVLVLALSRRGVAESSHATDRQLDPLGQLLAVAGLGLLAFTASSLINVSRLVGATLGVAVLGSIFAALSSGAQTAALSSEAPFLVGMRAALLVGALAELVGSLVAFGVIDRCSAASPARPGWTPAVRELRNQGLRDVLGLSLV
jgi:MFS family permease